MRRIQRINRTIFGSLASAALLTGVAGAAISAVTVATPAVTLAARSNATAIEYGSPNTTAVSNATAIEYGSPNAAPVSNVTAIEYGLGADRVRAGPVRAGRPLRADPVQRGLVGQRDRELTSRGGVEWRRRVQSLHVWLRRAQLVPGEIGLR